MKTKIDTQIEASDQRIAEAMETLRFSERGQRVLRAFRTVADAGASGLDMKALVVLTNEFAAGRRDKNVGMGYVYDNGAKVAGDKAGEYLALRYWNNGPITPEQIIGKSPSWQAAVVMVRREHAKESAGPHRIIRDAMSRILVWFSCGAASAVAAKKILELYPDHAVEIVCCDTRPSEHPDNYRFALDVERWLGRPIVYIRNPKYEVVDDVFEDTRYMAGVRGARCTQELKKIPRLYYAAADDHHVFGFTADEGKRVREFTERNPAMLLINVLCDSGITKQDCYRIIREAGIELPVMYRLGFDNNNCPGCVKASSPWYWDMVRTHFPEVFKRRCEQSRALGVRLVEIHHHDRIFLDELPAGPFKRRKKKENLSCGPECGTSKP